MPRPQIKLQPILEIQLVFSMVNAVWNTPQAKCHKRTMWFTNYWQISASQNKLLWATD